MILFPCMGDDTWSVVLCYCHASFSKWWYCLVQFIELYLWNHNYHYGNLQRDLQILLGFRLNNWKQTLTENNWRCQKSRAILKLTNTTTLLTRYRCRLYAVGMRGNKYCSKLVRKIIRKRKFFDWKTWELPMIHGSLLDNNWIPWPDLLMSSKSDVNLYHLLH